MRKMKELAIEQTNEEEATQFHLELDNNNLLIEKLQKENCKSKR